MSTARVVTVHVASVHGLQQDDPNQFAELTMIGVYLKMTVGKHSRKSSVMRKTQDPCFDESFDFYPDDSTASASLHVQIFDKARAKDNKPLGECTLPLAEALLEAQQQPLHRSCIHRARLCCASQSQLYRLIWLRTAS